ncbi:peroxidase 3-like protein, partial [Tanacetum coccineum]
MKGSCPKAEKIVQDYVNKHIPNAPSLAAALIRMNFHDCFVRGCDASILLNFTSASGNQTEKVAIPNQTVRGFGFIDAIKSLVEAECPGVVSCANIIALASRDSIVATGGPSWKVPTGRRDGLFSNASEALAQIPAPFDNITVLIQKFANKSLDVKDLVLLSGAHTIGISHCPSTQNDNTTKVEMDPGSRKTLDLSYYSLLLKRRGLFESDSALTRNSNTLTYINQLLQGSLQNFFSEFALSMVKMNQIEVKTGTSVKSEGIVL